MSGFGMMLLQSLFSGSGSSEDKTYKAPVKSQSSPEIVLPSQTGLGKSAARRMSGMDSGFYGHAHPADHKCNVNIKGSPECKKASQSRASSRFDKM